MAQLTVKAIAEGIEHFLSQEGDPSIHPDLYLQGVPDERMAKLLEAKGGTIRITISALPAELMQDVVRSIESPYTRPEARTPLEEFEARMAEAAGR